MGYLHCPSCARPASLDATAEPPLLCRHCATPLAPIPAPLPPALTEVLCARFERDMQHDAVRPRFVRG